MKILIADDHAVVRAGLKQILTGVSGITEIDGVANLCLSVKTVSTYKVRIHEKMKLETRVDITSYAIKNKLIDW